MTSRRLPPRPQRAVTLVELLIAIAVVGVLLTLAAPSFRDFILLQRLKSVNAQLVTDLQFARSEAAARAAPVNVWIRPVGGGSPFSCYILFTDRTTQISTACDCRRAEGERCSIVEAREIRSVLIPSSLQVAFSAPAGQATHFAFDPANGAILLPPTDSEVAQPPTFSIRTAVDLERSLVVMLSPAGRPTVCAPAGSTMSEVACP